MTGIDPAQAPSTVQGSGHAPRLILFLTVFLDLLGFGIVIPFLPMFAERLHVGGAGIGAVLAVYSLAQFLCAPVLGRISDRVGRRPIIMLGLLGSSISYLIYGFAGSFVMLLVSRAVHGACAGTVSTAQAYVADTTDESKRAAGMGVIGAAFGLGFVLGPAIGGVLGRHSLRMPVFFAAALTSANFIFAAAALPESHTPDRSAALSVGHLLSPLLQLPQRLTRGARLPGLFALAFLLTFALAALEATFAMMVPQVYGYGAEGVGWLLAYAGFMQALTQGYMVGRMVHRFGELRLIRAGLVALAIGFAPIGTVPSHALFFAALGLLSLGYGLASPSVASLISKTTERHLQGEVLGVNQSALSLARIAGPIAGGLIYEGMGPAAPYGLGAIVGVVALALTFALQRWRAGSSPAAVRE